MKLTETDEDTVAGKVSRRRLVTEPARGVLSDSTQDGLAEGRADPVQSLPAGNACHAVDRKVS